MPTRIDQRQRVQRGLAYLTALYPDWHQVIDTKALSESEDGLDWPLQQVVGFLAPELAMVNRFFVVDNSTDHRHPDWLLEHLKMIRKDFHITTLSRNDCAYHGFCIFSPVPTKSDPQPFLDADYIFDSNFLLKAEWIKALENEEEE